MGRAELKSGSGALKGMSSWKATHTFFVKGFSIFLVAVFSLQQISWAQGGKGLLPITISSRNPYGPDGSSFDIPSAYGRIMEDLVERESDEMVINIQDAHASLSAQKSIVSLLDDLVKNYRVDLIALEGSEGAIDTSILGTFPEPETKEQVAWSLMEEGRLSAGEFFAITRNTDIPLWGVEQVGLYDENLDKFRALMESACRLGPALDNLEGALKGLESDIYSLQLKELVRDSNLHRRGELGFSEYWEKLLVLAKEHKLFIPEFENLKRLSKVIELESEIDFLEANAERRHLIDYLSGELQKKELEGLLLKTVSFQEGVLSVSCFHEHLLMLASRHSLDPGEYGNLSLFARYTALYESLDVLALYDEIGRVEARFRDALYRCPEEKELFELSRMADKIRRLFNAQLARDESAWLRSELEHFGAGRFLSFIERQSPPAEKREPLGPDIELLFSEIDGALEFYRIAEKRDKLMFENTVKRMRESGTHVAALITGGYHTDGLTELMRENHLSYLVIMPKFDSDSTRPYVTVLTNRERPYRELVEAGHYHLAVGAFFAHDDVDTLLDAFIYPLASEFSKGRTGARLEYIKEAWITAYRDHFSSLADEDPRKAEALRKGHTPEWFDRMVGGISLMRFEGAVIVIHQCEEGVRYYEFCPEDLAARSLVPVRPGMRERLEGVLSGRSSTFPECWGPVPMDGGGFTGAADLQRAARSGIIALGKDLDFLHGVRREAKEIAETDPDSFERTVDREWIERRVRRRVSGLGREVLEDAEVQSALDALHQFALYARFWEEEKKLWELIASAGSADAAELEQFILGHMDAEDQRFREVFSFVDFGNITLDRGMFSVPYVAARGRIRFEVSVGIRTEGDRVIVEETPVDLDEFIAQPVFRRELASRIRSISSRDDQNDFENELLEDLLRASDVLLGAECRTGELVELKDVERLIIIGDLHTDIAYLEKVLEGMEEQELSGGTHLVFLGDFAGPSLMHLASQEGVLFGAERAVRVLHKVAGLVHRHPGNVHIAAGNGDMGFDWKKANIPLREGIKAAFSGEGSEMLRAASEFFDAMPLFVLADTVSGERVYLSHGANMDVRGRDDLAGYDRQGAVDGFFALQAKEIAERIAAGEERFEAIKERIDVLKRDLGCSRIVSGHIHPVHTTKPRECAKLGLDPASAEERADHLLMGIVCPLGEDVPLRRFRREPDFIIVNTFGRKAAYLEMLDIDGELQVDFFRLSREDDRVERVPEIRVDAALAERAARERLNAILAFNLQEAEELPEWAEDLDVPSIVASYRAALEDEVLSSRASYIAKKQILLLLLQELRISGLRAFKPLGDLVLLDQSEESMEAHAREWVPADPTTRQDMLAGCRRIEDALVEMNAETKILDIVGEVMGRLSHVPVRTGEVVPEVGTDERVLMREVDLALQELSDPNSLFSSVLAGIYGADDLERQTERYRTLLERFRELHPDIEEVCITRAGGRFIISGEHLDYHHGPVLNVALLNDIVVVAGADARSERISLDNMSESFDPASVRSPGEIEVVPRPKRELEWWEYCFAAIRNFSDLIQSQDGSMPGIAVLVDGRTEYGGVPAGVGLSSSGALEVSLILALAGITGSTEDITVADVTDLCVKTELSLGFICGIQDPYGSLMGGRVAERGMHYQIMDSVPRQGSDSRPKVRSELLPAPEGYESFMIRVGGEERTRIRRDQHNTRVLEGELGAYMLYHFLKDEIRREYPEKEELLESPETLNVLFPDLAVPENRHFPPFWKVPYFSLSTLQGLGIPFTRDELYSMVEMLPDMATKDQIVERFSYMGLTEEKFDQFAQKCQVMEDVNEIRFNIRGNARFVISESERADASADALRYGDLERFFALQEETGHSLKADYGIENPLAEELLELLMDSGFVRTARVLGPGSGANIAVWVEDSFADSFPGMFRNSILPQVPELISEGEEETEGMVMPVVPGPGAGFVYPSPGPAGRTHPFSKVGAERARGALVKGVLGSGIIGAVALLLCGFDICVGGISAGVFMLLSAAYARVVSNKFLILGRATFYHAHKAISSDPFLSERLSEEQIKTLAENLPVGHSSINYSSPFLKRQYLRLSLSELFDKEHLDLFLGPQTSMDEKERYTEALASAAFRAFNELMINDHRQAAIIMQHERFTSEKRGMLAILPGVDHLVRAFIHWYVDMPEPASVLGIGMETVLAERVLNAARDNEGESVVMPDGNRIETIGVAAMVLTPQGKTFEGRQSVPSELYQLTGKKYDHAEIMAIRNAESQGYANWGQYTIFTSLEPCYQCAKAIANRGAKRVVIGTLDPSKAIRGRGVRMLVSAGIEVALVPEDMQSRELERLVGIMPEHMLCEDPVEGTLRFAKKPISPRRRELNVERLKEEIRGYLTGQTAETHDSFFEVYEFENAVRELLSLTVLKEEEVPQIAAVNANALYAVDEKDRIFDRDPFKHVLCSEQSAFDDPERPFRAIIAGDRRKCHDALMELDHAGFDLGGVYILTGLGRGDEPRLVGADEFCPEERSLDHAFSCQGAIRTAVIAGFVSGLFLLSGLSAFFLPQMPAWAGVAFLLAGIFAGVSMLRYINLSQVVRDALEKHGLLEDESRLAPIAFRRQDGSVRYQDAYWLLQPKAQDLIRIHESFSSELKGMLVILPGISSLASVLTDARLALELKYVLLNALLLPIMLGGGLPGGVEGREESERVPKGTWVHIENLILNYRKSPSPDLMERILRYEGAIERMIEGVVERTGIHEPDIEDAESDLRLYVKEQFIPNYVRTEARLPTRLINQIKHQAERIKKENERRDSRERPIEEIAHLSDGMELVEQLSFIEPNIIGFVRSFLNRRRANLGSAFILHFFHGLTLREIALSGILGENISVQRVRQLLFEAGRNLGEELLKRTGRLGVLDDVRVTDVLPTAVSQRPKEYAITGVTGFLGSNLIQVLGEGPLNINALVRPGTPNLHRIRTELEKIDLTQGDILDHEAITELIDGADVVYHLGAISDHDQCKEDPAKTFAVNSLGTAIAAYMADDSNKRFVFGSTFYVYSLSRLPDGEKVGPSTELLTGDEAEMVMLREWLDTAEEVFSIYARRFISSEGSPSCGDPVAFVERFLRENPLPEIEPERLSELGLPGDFLYPLSKYLAERLIINERNTLILRFSNIYGPGQDERYKVPMYTLGIATAEEGSTYDVWPDSRDFIYVGDWAQAMIRAGEIDITPRSKVIDIASGRHVRSVDIATAIASELERDDMNIIETERPVVRATYCIDPENFRVLLHPERLTTLKEAILHTVRYYVDGRGDVKERGSEDVLPEGEEGHSFSAGAGFKAALLSVVSFFGMGGAMLLWSFLNYAHSPGLMALSGVWFVLLGAVGVATAYRYYSLGRVVRDRLEEMLLAQGVDPGAAKSLADNMSIAYSTIDYSSVDVRCGYMGLTPEQLIPGSAIREGILPSDRETREELLDDIRKAAYMAYVSLDLHDRPMADLLRLHESVDYGFFGGWLSHALGMLVLSPFLSIFWDARVAHKSMSPYEQVMADTESLSGIQGVIADFDGVDKSHQEGTVSDRTMEAKATLSALGVMNITVSGDGFQSIKKKYGGQARMARLSAGTSYVLVSETGSDAHVVHSDGEIERLPGFRNPLTDRHSFGEILRAAKEAIKEFAEINGITKDIYLEVFEEDPDIYTENFVCGEGEGRINLLFKVNELGSTIYVGGIEPFAEKRFELAEIFNRKISSLISEGRITDNAQILVSKGGIDLVAQDKAKAAIQAIKLFGLESVLIIADSVGTEKMPGNDRALLELDQEALSRAGIDRHVDLIKVYVGDERVVDIPSGVVVADSLEEESASARRMYRAVSQAKQEKGLRSEDRADILVGVPGGFISEGLSARVRKLFPGVVLANILDRDDPDAIFRDMETMRRTLGANSSAVLDLDGWEGGEDELFELIAEFIHKIRVSMLDIVHAELGVIDERIASEMSENEISRIVSLVMRAVPVIEGRRFNEKSIFDLRVDSMYRADRTDYDTDARQYLDLLTAREQQGGRRYIATTVDSAMQLRLLGNAIRERRELMEVCADTEDPVRDILFLKIEGLRREDLGVFLEATGSSGLFRDQDIVLVAGDDAPMLPQELMNEILEIYPEASPEEIAIADGADLVELGHDLYDDLLEELLLVKFEQGQTGLASQVYRVTIDIIAANDSIPRGLDRETLRMVDGVRLFIFVPEAVPVDIEEEARRYELYVREVLTRA